MSAGYDPQQLSLKGKISALIALGRIPFALEVPIWTILGCLLSSQVFPVKGAGFLRSFDPWATLQCALVTWGTNVAINYGNEYFDWNLDRPSQVEAIERNKAKHRGEIGMDSGENAKLMANTTRIIHDGTFPPWTALACCGLWQLGLFALIVYSRSHDPSINSNTQSPHYTPFKGLGIHIGLICTFLSHSYVGPPLRLHYHGFGELVSALFLSPVAVVFGIVGHYTAVSGQSMSWSDLFSKHSTFTLDKQLWTLIAAFYFFEQARIFVMHINDIDADIRGGKRTLVSRVGHRTAKNLYALFNLAAMGLFVSFARSLSSRGVFSKASGGSAAFSGIWVAGLSLVLAYSIPIWTMVYNALVAEIPSNKAKPRSTTLLPSISMGTATLLVSMQTLGTPAVLSLVTLFAGYASG